MSYTAFPAGLAALVVLLTCAPPARPLLTEVYYDAPGDDTGWEFVELYNPLAHDVALAGLKLQAGNGSGAGKWTTRWTGAAHDTLRAGARFVIGGAHVVPAPEATVTLDLGNGPDAVRVVWPDGASETVGWGALQFPEYYCGAPASDVAPGQSLARVPDTADLGSNALDFRPAEPSPGRANRPDVDLAVVRGSLAIAPGLPQPGEAVIASLLVLNRGAATVSNAGVRLAGDALADTVALALGAIAPGETLRVTPSARAGSAGQRTLVAAVDAPLDAERANDADTLRVRVGAGPLELTEIQFHPAAGEGEWVELHNRSADEQVLSDFTLSDATNTPTPVLDAMRVPPDSLALLAQDRSALLAAYPALDPARVASVHTWPSLNNTNGADGVADVVQLRETDGTPVERVAYSAAGVTAGATLERVAGTWRASPTPGGTPLALPAVPATGAGVFAVTPHRVPLGAPEVTLAWRLPWADAHVSVELYDLAGRRVALLLDDVAAGALGERRVRLDGAGPGVFAAVLRARSAHATLTRGVLLRIAGTQP